MKEIIYDPTPYLKFQEEMILAKERFYRKEAWKLRAIMILALIMAIEAILAVVAFSP